MDYSKLSDDELLSLLQTEEDRLPRAALDAFVARGERMIEPLTQIVKDARNWEESGAEYWAPIHATLILGAIGGARVVPGLMATLEGSDSFDDNDVADELPYFFARIGAPAVQPLLRFIDDTEFNADLHRFPAVAALAAIADLHPDCRALVLDALLDVAKETGDMIASEAARALLPFRRPEDLAIIGELTQREDPDDDESLEMPLVDPKFIRDARDGKVKHPEYLDPLRFYSEEAMKERAERRAVAAEDMRWAESGEEDLEWMERESKELRARYVASLAGLNPKERYQALGAFEEILDFASNESGFAPWNWDSTKLDEYFNDYYRPHDTDPREVLRYLQFLEREGRLPSRILIELEKELRDIEAAPPVTDDSEILDAIAPEAAKPDRNDPCPCGSGKKHKKCCG